MNTLKDFKLIKGTFEATEAKEILLKLINYKIQFHQLASLSLYERNKDLHDENPNRIAELQATKSELEAFLLAAEAKNLSLKIDSTITIEVHE